MYVVTALKWLIYKLPWECDEIDIFYKIILSRMIGDQRP